MKGFHTKESQMVRWSAISRVCSLFQTFRAAKASVGTSTVKLALSSFYRIPSLMSDCAGWSGSKASFLFDLFVLFFGFFKSHDFVSLTSFELIMSSFLTSFLPSLLLPGTFPLLPPTSPCDLFSVSHDLYDIKLLFV